MQINLDTDKQFQLYKNGEKIGQPYIFDEYASQGIQNGELLPFVQTYQCELQVY